MPEEMPIERLIQENLGLIQSVVAKIIQAFPILPAGYDRDDLESLGHIGLVQAAQTFDPTQGILFSTYASRCIENKIRSALMRAREREGAALSPDVPTGKSEEALPEGQRADESVSEEKAFMDSHSQEALREAVQQLPAPYDEIMRRLYVDGQSMADVASELGLSPPRLVFLHNRALRMLRRHFRGEPPTEE